MTIMDVFILIAVIVLLATIIYFNIIKPKIKHENTCCKCPYSKQCKEKNKSSCDSKKEIK